MARVVELGAQEAGTHGFTFDGKSKLGFTLADGEYQVAIAATGAGEDKPTQVPASAPLAPAGGDTRRVAAIHRSGEQFRVTQDVGGGMSVVLIASHRPIARTMRHYSRGVAYSAKGKVAEARLQRQRQALLSSRYRRSAGSSAISTGGCRPCDRI